MIDTAILLPCYNEAPTIEKTVLDIKKALPSAHVFVYDNNSTDGSGALAAAAGATVVREHIQGKGAVVRRMFREIDARCYIMLDADDTYDTAKLPEFRDAILSGQYDMVIGDRLSSSYFNENKRRFHGMGNLLVRTAINLIFGAGVKDVMTGMRAFSRRFVKTFPVTVQGFEIETAMTIHAARYGLPMKNIVIEYRDRREGSESKLDTIPDGIRVLWQIFQMVRTYRPIAFFGAIAAAAVLLACVLIVPVITEYARTGLVPRFPTLIGAGFIGIAGIQSMFAGLILAHGNDKDRRDFELKYLNTDRGF